MRKLINIQGLVVVIFSILTSCSNYKFTDGDLEWQPYNEGDILIFESNKKVVDTVYITEIATYSNPEDHLAFVSDYHESLFVTGVYTLPEPEKDHLGNYYNRETIKLLSMHADADSYIDFNLVKIGDSLKYARASFTIEEINTYFDKIQKLEFKGIKDVIPIETNSTYSIEYDLQNIWWSKKYGYVRYEYKNNDYWELKKFIRDGKDILAR